MVGGGLGRPHHGLRVGVRESVLVASFSTSVRVSAVRSVEVSEAWQEGRQDFVTVRFLANLLDYTVDETGTQVMEGSRTEPVKFEEYWTFVRPVGPNTWRLSAIQQSS